MAKNIELTRQEAELLDDLLLDYVKRNPEGFDRHATLLAGELCALFKMPPWHERKGSDVSAEEWRDWTTRTS